MRDSFGPGGVLFYGQGKWYPGEPLPHWKFGCFWRKDGLPIWRNDTLLAEPYKDYGFGVEHAEKFTRHLADQLNVPSDYIRPAYEDIVFFLWTEGKLPINIDPNEFDFKEISERQKLIQLLQTEKIGEPIGYVFPLGCNFENNSWESCAWNFKSEHMFLIPGDSPLGYRLPLESLPWVDQEKEEPFFERDPFEPRDTNINLSDATDGRDRWTYARCNPTTTASCSNRNFPT